MSATATGTGLDESASLRSGSALVALPDSARKTLSLRRVNAVSARAGAVMAIVFVLQSIPAMMEQLPNMRPAWSIAVVAALYASLLWCLIAAFRLRGVRIANVTFALVYLVALVTWPLAVLEPADAPAAHYWLYHLLTVATALTAISLDWRIATAHLLITPTIYAVLRTLPAGGGIPAAQAALDSIYSLLLGGAIIVLTTALRIAALGVDRAQQAAFERYSHAVRHHAIEAERVQVDAIVHDSVLATLLAAARASTAEAKSLAAMMAGNAIRRLGEAMRAAPVSRAALPMRDVAERIVDVAGTMAHPFDTRIDDTGELPIPLPAADAIYSAAVQAMVNSIQHAGPGVPRWVDVHTTPDGQLEVVVGDGGRGFDIARVPTERLGLRVSIIERTRSAGGDAEIRTQPGSGTTVTLRWPSLDDEEA